MVGKSRRWCAGSSKHEHDVHLSTEHFTVTTSDIDPVFHICDSANKFFPAVDILNFVKEQIWFMINTRYF